MSLLKNIYFVSLLLGLYTPLSQAGHENGNGGGAVVCRNSKKEIISAELLDLWEVRTLKGSLLSSEGSQEQLLHTALNSLVNVNPLFGTRVHKALQANSEIVSDIPQGTYLVPPTDAQNWMMQEGCSLESVAQYRTDPQGDRLYIAKELFYKMSPLSQAALWIHEAVYKVLRDDDGDENSIRARAITAGAFGQRPSIEIPAPQIACFQDLAENQSSYSFSLLATVKGDRFLAWVSRADKKWQVPSLPIQVSSAGEKNFIDAMKLQIGKTAPDFSPAALIPLRLNYGPSDKPNTLTATLTPKISAPSGNVYEFNLFLAPKMKARCVLE